MFLNTDFYHGVIVIEASTLLIDPFGIVHYGALELFLSQNFQPLTNTKTRDFHQLFPSVNSLSWKRMKWGFLKEQARLSRDE